MANADIKISENKGIRSMKRLVKIVSLGTVTIPLGIALILSLFLLIDVHLFHDSSYYFLPELKTYYYLVALLYLVAGILTGYGLTLIKYNYWRFILVFGIALLPRWLIIILFKQQLYPFSDFLWSWEVALGAREGFSYAAHLPFPAYQVWAFFEFLLTKILSKSYCAILLTNAVLDSLIAVCILGLARNIVADNRYSIVASLLYALFPSSIIYCTTGTPEFVAILFNLFAMILLIKAFKINGKKHYYLLISAGLMFGISSSFKSFSIVIIVAYLITELFYAQNISSTWKVLGDGLILLFSFFVIKEAILFVVSLWIGTDLSQYSSGVIFHQLLVGLNTEGEGQIHLGSLSREYWNVFLDSEYNSTVAANHAKKVLFDNWNSHLSEIPVLIERKIVWAWQDDLIPFHYFFNAMGVDGSIHHGIYETIKNIAPTIAQVMYTALCVFGVVKGIDDFRNNNNNIIWFFIKMIVFGFFVLLLIIEAQSRYKCLILPLICILSADGIIKILNFSRCPSWRGCNKK